MWAKSSWTCRTLVCPKSTLYLGRNRRWSAGHLWKSMFMSSFDLYILNKFFNKFQVLLLLGAVACHKFVVGFCLGVELSSTPGSRFRNQLLAILIFSFGSILGIGVGMAIIDLKTVYDTPALQVLQALAGGTLLYVTVCEVLPREKARWHLSDRKYAGVGQCLSVIVGFTTMTLLSIFLSECDWFFYNILYLLTFL